MVSGIWPVNLLVGLGEKSFLRDVCIPIFTWCTYIESRPTVEKIFSDTAVDPGIRYEV